MQKLSASQLSMYRRCSMQFWYRYKAGIKLRPVGKMTKGRSVHKGVQTGFEYKVRANEDPPRELVLDATASEFDHVASFTQWEKDEKPGTLKDRSLYLASMHHAGVMPDVDPIQVEAKIEYPITPEIQMNAYLDVITLNGQVRDTKCVGRTVDEKAIRLDLQLSSYVIGAEYAGLPINTIALDRLVDVKRPWIQQIELRRDQVDTDRTKHIAESVAAGIAAEQYHPVDNPHICSWCGYAPICLGKKWWAYLLDPELAKRAAKAILMDGLMPEEVQSIRAVPDGLVAKSILPDIAKLIQMSEPKEDDDD